ncbi:helix-turn-helix domain-containing protein [Tsukamurella soli]|uniref:Helix-turn-helix domain-containing protein n=1 Tax=Tsukamurella soli TaxID=644556 RepID=A0ABP8JA64_9ACTN
MSEPDLAEALAQLVRAAAQAAPAAAPAPRRLLTVEQAADQLAVSRSHVYAMLKDGRLRGVKLGRARRIAQAEIDELIERGGATGWDGRLKAAG